MGANTTDLRPEVADGVYRCGSERVNWYLIEADDGLVVVDTGFPSHWDRLLERLEALEYDVADVDACLLTHAHPDHAGFAERLRREADVSVWLHEGDADHARGEGSSKSPRQSRASGGRNCSDTHSSSPDRAGCQCRR